MFLWLLLGLIVLGLVLLGLAARPVLVRLPALRRAVLRSQRSAIDAQTLQMSVAHLQERLDQLAGHAAEVQTRVVEIQKSRSAG
jgi:hypothetical protein